MGLTKAFWEKGGGGLYRWIELEATVGKEGLVKRGEKFSAVVVVWHVTPVQDVRTACVCVFDVPDLWVYSLLSAVQETDSFHGCCKSFYHVEPPGSLNPSAACIRNEVK